MAGKNRTPHVVVVGGGPAGCAAATTLAAAGVSVSLFERGTPGRDKPCGDGLLSRTVDALSDLGITPEDFRRMGGLPFDQVELYGEFLTDRLALFEHRGGWVIPRAALDQTLRDVAAGTGTAVVYGARVVSVAPRTDKVSLHVEVEKDGRRYEARASAVVVATGAGSPLARQFSICGEPLVAASLTAYANGLKVIAPLLQFTADCFPGYRWAFPLPGGKVNLGVCSLKAGTKSLRASAQRLVSDLGASPIGRWRGGGGPLWTGRASAWHHPCGIVACGDAAGLVDPLTGEGISAALTSGREAGRTIARFVGGRAVAELEGYSAYLRRHFHERYSDNPFRDAFMQLSGLPSLPC